MAKEKDFNSLIEKQDEETKKRTFEKLQAKLAENDDDISRPNQNVLVKKTFWQKRNIVIIGMVFLLLVVGVVLFVLLHKNNTDNFKFRYCTASDYHIEDSEQTIKQYAEDNKLDILFFDSDNGFEILLSQQYKLNATNEVICLYEELVVNDNFIIIYITDNVTEIELLKNYTTLCNEGTQINDLNILYGIDDVNAYAKFEYNNYVYYFQVWENADIDYLLNLVAELIN